MRVKNWLVIFQCCKYSLFKTVKDFLIKFKPRFNAIGDFMDLERRANSPSNR